MHWILKNWPSVALLIAGIIACVASFVSGNRDSEQKDEIQKLGEQNVKLSNEIKTLSGLSLTIGQQVDTIVRQVDTVVKKNTDLANENIALTNTANQLITEVKTLTAQSKEITHKLDIKTDEEFAVSGEFEFKLQVDSGGRIPLTLLVGSNTAGFEIARSLPDGFLELTPSMRGIFPIEFKLKGLQLYLSCMLYDFDKRLLIEIDNNKWRVNKKLVGKFNFDEKGFEVFDDEGRIITSFDIQEHNTLLIQGIFPDFNRYRTTISSRKYNMTNIHGVNKNDPDIVQAIEDAHFVQLFEYTGNKWHGVRKP